MIAAVGLQLLVVCVLSAIAFFAWGAAQGWHLMLGGLAAWVPNALFALRLALQRGRRPEGYPVVFFVGEFAKIGLTVVFLFLTVKAVPDLQWLPWLIGLIAAVKAPLLFGVRAL